MVEISKGINFMPEFIVKENAKRKRTVMIAAITAIVTLFGIFIYFIPYYEVLTLNTKLVGINSEINDMQDIRDIKQQLDDTKTKLDAKKKILNEIRGKEIDTVLITQKLLSVTPPNVTLDYYNMTDSQTISANYIISTPDDMVDLTNRLRALNIFEKVEIPATPIVDRQANVNFRLKLAKAIPVEHPVPKELEPTPPPTAPTAPTAPAQVPTVKATTSGGVSASSNLAVPTVTITKNTINKKYYLNITGMGTTYQAAAVYTSTMASELSVDTASDGREPIGSDWAKKGTAISTKAVAADSLGIIKGSGVKYIVIKVAKNNGKAWGVAYSKVIPWDDAYLNASK